MRDIVRLSTPVALILIGMAGWFKVVARYLENPTVPTPIIGAVSWAFESFLFGLALFGVGFLATLGKRAGEAMWAQIADRQQ